MFKFDCINEVHDCVQKTSTLRKDILPLIEPLVNKLYESATRNHKWLSSEVDQMPQEDFCTGFQHFLRPNVRPLALSLGLLYSQSGNVSALKQDMAKIVIDTFRMPDRHVLQELKTFFIRNDKWHLLDIKLKDSCFPNSSVSREAIIFSYGTLFTSGLFGFKKNGLWPEIRLGSFLGDSILNGNEDKLNISFMQKFSQIISKLLDNNSVLPVKSIIQFLKDSWYSSHFDSSHKLLGCKIFNNWFWVFQQTLEPESAIQFCAMNSTWSCCDFESELSKDLNSVFKVMKYTLSPLGKIVVEEGEKQDLKLAKQSGYTMLNYLTNVDPVILACKYGDIKLNSYCDLFRKFFTTTGIGYTFNNEPFHKMFKNTKDNKAFFKEMYDLGPSLQVNTSRKILSNGQRHSFEFIVNMIDKAKLISVENQKMVIHDPFVVPDTRNEAIELKAGMTYEITITPSVTVTDTNGLQLDPAQRECRSKSESETLDIFQQYSQSSCLFECQLKRAINICNCSAWYYPRLNGKVNLCWHPIAEACFEKQMESSDVMSCNCPNDCDSVHYSIGLQITPLDVQNICGMYQKTALSTM